MDQSKQVTSISFFRYPKNRRWWAFNQMQLAQKILQQTEGVLFGKLMGTGGGFGFSLKPDFRTYALLIVWENNSYAGTYYDTELFGRFNQQAESQTTHWMACVQSHGSWGGKNPFSTSAPYERGPLMVITRARVRWQKIPQFLLQVPRASKSAEHAKGLVFTKGIGEWPAIEQATFSIWASESEMKSYAYRAAHQEIIRKVKKERWYGEELFARFVPLEEPVR
ncbi:MAG: spheroidene monooxygenase [Lunatimonas sp.]|nr:spheroidene monooxygenase [Lunatimonas sp.]